MTTAEQAAQPSEAIRVASAVCPPEVLTAVHGLERACSYVYVGLDERTKRLSLRCRWKPSTIASRKARDEAISAGFDAIKGTGEVSWSQYLPSAAFDQARIALTGAQIETLRAIDVVRERVRVLAMAHGRVAMAYLRRGEINERAEWAFQEAVEFVEIAQRLDPNNLNAVEANLGALRETLKRIENFEVDEGHYARVLRALDVLTRRIRPKTASTGSDRTEPRPK